MNQSAWNEFFQNRLRVFEDRVLRKIFVPTKDERDVEKTTQRGA
jgi:hypothetical protein